MLFKGFPPRPQPKLAEPERTVAAKTAPMVLVRLRQTKVVDNDEPPPGLTRERCLWELDRIERRKIERAEREARYSAMAHAEYRKRVPLNPPLRLR